MTISSNDPSLWPFINGIIVGSYWMVAASVVVVYDWALTLGQEIELIWRQRWSLMTVLYLVIRYIGIPYCVSNILGNAPVVSLTDAGCKTLYYTGNGTTVVISALLGVITIARLHAMYQGSRKMLIFLVIIFLAVNIACGVIAAISLTYYVAEEDILFGIHNCGYYPDGNLLLPTMIWILNTVWEVLALCLSVWIAAKHFRDLRRLGPLTGSIMGDCFRVLVKSHVLYFACFAGVSCLQLIDLSPVLTNPDSIGVQTLVGACNVLLAVQMFVLGPRLILSVREYHAKFIADSNAEASMNPLVFQERLHISTSSTV